MGFISRLQSNYKGKPCSSRKVVYCLVLSGLTHSPTGDNIVSYYSDMLQWEVRILYDTNWPKTLSDWK